MSTRQKSNIAEVSDSAAAEAVAVERPGGGSRLGLFSAYTLLLVWGATYLVLFFTDRLPF